MNAPSGSHAIAAPAVFQAGRANEQRELEQRLEAAEKLAVIGRLAAGIAHEKLRYPMVIRLVLSGHSERDAVLRALPTAQQFLSKPCDPEDLRILLSRACQFQALVKDEGLRNVLGRIDRLPSAPEAYWALTQAVGEANVTPAQIAQIVEQDPAMSVKVLQLANSAFFGTAKPVTSVAKAVAQLGTEMIRGLALTLDMFGAPEGSAIDGFSVATFQQHALLVAKLARGLLTDPAACDAAFMAALMHDVGQLIMAAADPGGFEAAVRQSRASGRPIEIAERAIFGTTHADVGGYLLGSWGLPLSIVEAVAFHHTPGAVTEGPCDVLGAVHVASALIEEVAEPGNPTEPRLDMAFVERVGLAGKLPAWRAMAHEAMAVLRTSG